MQTPFQQIKNYFRPVRKPAGAGQLAALANAVLIVTEDGHSVFITPAMARDIAPILPRLANAAEGVTNATRAI